VAKVALNFRFWEREVMEFSLPDIDYDYLEFKLHVGIRIWS